ncbi:MAG: hypothetical protein ACTHOF_12535 [Flavisolibacter sp.]
MRKGGSYELPLYGSVEIPKLERLTEGKPGILHRVDESFYEAICNVHLTLQLGTEYLMYGDCGFIFDMRPDGVEMYLQKGELVKGDFYFAVNGNSLCDMGNYYNPKFYYRWRVDKIERLTMVKESPDEMETVTMREIDTTREDCHEDNIDRLTLTLLNPVPTLGIGNKTLATQKDSLVKGSFWQLN